MMGEAFPRATRKHPHKPASAGFVISGPQRPTPQEPSRPEGHYRPQGRFHAERLNPMATTNDDQMMMSSDAEDQADGGADESQEQGQGGYCIEIHVGADGSLSVSTESEADEANEEGGAGGEGGEGGEADKGTSVPNIKAALTLALSIFKADGQMPDGGDAGGDSEFESGYSARSAS